MLGRLVNQMLKGAPPEYPWGDTLPFFEAAGFRFCNLECVLSDRGRPWSATPKAFHFRSDSRNVAVLAAAGIELVSLANNHVLDYEHDALLEMLSVLERAGIRGAGAGRNRDEAWRPAIVSHGESRLGMIACTDNEPGWEASERIPGTCYVPIDLDDRRARRLLGLVGAVAEQVDCLLVSLHWGPNWGYRPPPEHVAFAHALVEAGADIVAGHSAHIFRGIEIYRGKPILYSAGDFIDDYAVDELERNDESFLFTVDFSGRQLRGIALRATLIREFQARLAEPRQARRIATKMESLCAEFGTRATWDEGANLLRLRVNS
jgi:poly-gamma-glutamate capsule biosynthesis protein CapA/YwtB (metallophosphatase superfamily)